MEPFNRSTVWGRSGALDCSAIPGHFDLKLRHSPGKGLSRTSSGRGGSKRTGIRATTGMLACSLLAILSGCGKAASAQPVLSRADLVGVWVQSSGARMVFEANHQFEARDLNDTGFLSACPNASGPGTWAFVGSEGDSGPKLTTYSRGYLVFIRLDGRQSKCNFLVTSWEIHPPLGPCYDADPDSPCNAQVFTRVEHSPES
jgi:hypothetical protein